MKNILFALLTLVAGPMFAQNPNTMCGNGNFESGSIDPSEWSGSYGNFSANSCGYAVVSNNGFSSNTNIYQNDGNQTIVAAGTDPIISTLSTVPPYPSVNNYSLRLGNAAVCKGEESISKTFFVNPGDKYLRFWYAYVGDFTHANGAPSTVTPLFQVGLYDNTHSHDYSHLVNLGNGSNMLFATTADNFVVKYNNQWVYKIWSCVEIPLDSMVNSSVTLVFYNRDCTAGAHAGYTYIDNLCLDCYGDPSGSFQMDPANSDTCGLPGQICFNYTLPDNGSTTGDCQIDLTIYQNGTPLAQFNSPVLTSGTQYCFPLNTGNLSALNTGLGGFDFSATAHFTITDAGGNIQLLPDKTLGSAPDGMDLGSNNDYDLICGGNANCDSLSVTVNDLGGDQCCYAIDLHNHQSVPIAYMEATVNGDWVFATGYSAGAPFGWSPTAPGPNSLPISIQSPTGSHAIPQGDYPGVLNFCLEPARPNTTAPQILVFTWYAPAPGGQGFMPVCSDTIVRQCQPVVDEPCVTVSAGQVVCNPENPYEYIVSFQVTNHSGFTATHVTLDNLADPVTFGFSACNASNHLPSIVIPLSPALPDNATSGPLCVKFTSQVPILSPTSLTLTIGLMSPTSCCHNEDPYKVVLQPCCDPCGSIHLQSSPINVSQDDQCCWSLDVENDCGYKFFHKFEIDILTPGVQFGYHALGGPNASDWNVTASTPVSLSFGLNGANYIPKGTTMDLVQFCLDDIDQASEAPQRIVVKWFTQNIQGNDSLACTDTLVYDCRPQIDNECLAVSDQQLECSPNDSMYCYTFTVKNTSSIPFGATNLDLFEISGAHIDFNGSGGTFPLPPLNSGDSIRLTVCFDASPFPMTEDFLVFQYRLRYLMGDTCCYESTLDTIAVPNCFDSICPPTCCCYPSNIVLPTGLSPNNDGFNDTYVIKGIDRCNKVTLTVYNRWGNVVWKKDQYDNSWDGTNEQGNELPQGTYFVLLTLHDSGASMSGFVDLRRQ